MMELRGVITAMATPFARDQSLDVAGARRLARHLVDNGSDGLVVAGTTGESPTLSDAEKLELLDSVLDEVGDRATVIAGTGSNDTRHSAELTAAAVRAGAHAVIVVTPYYNRPNRAGIRAHYAAVAEAAGDLPLVLYNIPSRSVVNVTPDLAAELAAEIPNVVAIKQANDDDLGAIDGLDLLAGNDESFLRALEVGAVGGILVASHLIGPEMRAVLDAADAGDRDRAADLDAALVPIYRALTVAPNPIPLKAALEALGLIEGTLRLPMVPASDSERATVRTALEGRGLLSAAGAS